MKTVSGKKFAKVLEDHGWVLVRITKHHIYKSPDGLKTISVPVHNNDDLKVGDIVKLLEAGWADGSRFVTTSTVTMGHRHAPSFLPEYPMNENMMTRRSALRRLASLSLSLTGLSLTGLTTAAHADPDAAALDRLTREARRCEQLCAACTRHCAAMVKMGMTEHKRTLAVSRDCGEICGLTARLSERRSPDVAAMARACAVACGLCARECGRYADMKIMTDCARQSQACATACRAVYGAAKA